MKKRTRRILVWGVVTPLILLLIAGILIPGLTHG